jgi:hypothetical protein
VKKPMDLPLGATSGSAQIGGVAGGRGVELEGDSPELIAFVLLKNIVQIEQSKQNVAVFDKAWLLDTYAECLAAVHGKRAPAAPAGRGKAR